MAIKRVEIKDFRVFKGNFAIDLSPGVNVFIGDNGTGKTTLIKAMYENVKTVEYHRGLPISPGKMIFEIGESNFKLDNVCTVLDVSENLHGIYIPEKDILEHARGLLPFIERKQTGFSFIYKDVLIAAQDVPTQEQTETQKSIGEQITDIVGGTVEWDHGDGSFYTIKTDGSRIPFANEASAYKKLGFLGLLVSCGRLEPGCVLFWDEPENSLNPELIPMLIEILLKLALHGVQIFIATHNYDIVRYLDVRRNKNIPVLFHNMIKTSSGSMTCTTSPEYHTLPDNHLEKAGENLFKAVAADALGVQDNEHRA